jgi:hypothetical protein
MFLSSAGPLSTDGIGMITLSPLERTVNFVFVFFVKESARNQVQFFANATLDVSEVPVSDMSVREIVSKISFSGGQGFVHCHNRRYWNDNIVTLGKNT